MSDATGAKEDVPEASASEGTTTSAKKQNAWALMAPVTAAFALVVSAAVIAAYRFGEGVVYIGERTISEMNFIEVTSGTALGVLGALFGVVAAAVGAVLALCAAIIGAVVGAVGVVFGGLVVIGILTGPVLLAVMIGMMIKRRYWPDVI